MLDNSQFSISNRQLIFIILGNTVATGMISLPSIASKQAHQDAWLVVMGGAFAPLLVLLLVERLFRRFPGYSFTDISCLLFGKIIGKILVLSVLAYFIYFQAVVLSTVTQVTKVFVLPQTPNRVILIVIALAVVYVASLGAKAIANINEIYLYQFILFNILWLIPLFLAGDYTNLLPVGESGFKGLGYGILTTSFAYSGIEILLLVYPMVDKSQPVLKAGFIAVVFTMAFYLLLTLSSLAVFGSNALGSIIVWPGITILKVLDFPVIGRFEIFYLLLWMGFGLRPAFIMHMASSYTLSGLWGTTTNRTYQYYLLGLGAVMVLFAFVPISTDQVFRMADFSGRMFLVIGIVYPFLYLCMAALRSKLGSLQQYS
ncbi:GerAB/ArcD/ProY family transporter [Syntrophomonas palmitatica]|uniref:GerAB/ArcD/ProY family transporter n=1 Tax=Syntrophomonas palmitatica TaxID=402877 RepID=UPI0006CF334A|nr:endospore germination permease [Syntrophomonas palmitatica]